jgi:hypothetical protein
MNVADVERLIAAFRETILRVMAKGEGEVRATAVIRGGELTKASHVDPARLYPLTEEKPKGLT